MGSCGGLKAASNKFFCSEKIAEWEAGRGNTCHKVWDPFVTTVSK